MIRFLHIGRRGQQRENFGPGVSSALNRVREIREHADWQPLTDAASIHQRGDRVADVRREIHIPPLAHERDMRPESSDRSILLRDTYLLRDAYRSILYGSALVMTVLITAVGLVSWFPHLERKPVQWPDVPWPNVQQSTLAFPLADSRQYANLTQDQMIELARKALRANGLNQSDWMLELESYSGSYLRPINNYEATALFRHSYYSSFLVEVTVKLSPEDKYVLCTIKPK